MPRWRNMLLLKNCLMDSRITPSPSLFFASSIHSTPFSSEKWKNKWDPDSNGQQPSKTYIKYETRQKRADAKRALKNLLFHNGSGKTTFEDVHSKVETTNIWGQEKRKHSNSSNKKGKSKSSARGSKAHNHNKKYQSSRNSSFEDCDGYSDTFFQANFGGRCYTWSYRSAEEPSFQSSSSGFEWRDYSQWTNSNKEWDAAHETYSDRETCFPGSSSDRTVLGLPLTGPLKIEDVKTAFRLSALKWHPDKHQGPTQAIAEEKFKNCADAYKSLCNALV
ncbi:J domain-containing protein [Heracleum sosnowskyi]|uniref:J domain-containing protein n=1 Tax=Heracleum sosnowskyi TaxID=360622 RepID=A0AAD8M5I8_9APIA|nr:J domain-containing protein [Heracleum sosnowskyi]